VCSPPSNGASSDADWLTWSSSTPHDANLITTRYVEEDEEEEEEGDDEEDEDFDEEGAEGEDGEEEENGVPGKPDALKRLQDSSGTHVDR